MLIRFKCGRIMAAVSSSLPQHRKRQRGKDWAPAPPHQHWESRYLSSNVSKFHTFSTSCSAWWSYMHFHECWPLTVRCNPVRRESELDQLITCPASSARNSDLSAGSNHTRRTVTAFLRGANVELSSIFKPSQPGTERCNGSFTSGKVTQTQLTDGPVEAWVSNGHTN